MTDSNARRAGRVLVMGWLSVCAASCAQVDSPYDPVAVTRQPLVAVVQKVSAQAQTAKTITGTFAATPTEGNLLVAIVGNSGPQASATTPAGWSVAVQEPNNNPGMSTYYKRAGAAESASVTAAGFAAADNLGLQLFELSGVDAQAVPLVSSVSGNTVANTAFSSGNVTTTSDGALVIVGVTAQQNGGPPSFSGWTNSFVEQYDFIQNKGAFSSAIRFADVAGSYGTSFIPTGASTIRVQTVSFGRLPTPATDLSVTAGVRQTFVSFVVPSTVISHVLVLAKTADCTFSANPVGTEAKGTAVGNGVVIFNDSPTASLASTNVTIGGSTTTVSYTPSPLVLTHGSLTANTSYCYKVYVRNSSALDDNSGAGRPSRLVTPTAGGTTDPVFVHGFGSAGLSAPSVAPSAAAYYANSTGKVVAVSSNGARMFAPYTLTNGVQNRSPVGTLSGDAQKTMFVSSMNGDAFAIWATGASAGTLRWSTTAIDGNSGVAADQALGDALYATPTVANALGRVFIGTRNLSGVENRIFALSSTTGACAWVFNGTCGGTTTALNVGQISSMPMYDSVSQRLFFTSTKLGSGGTLWALDAKDTPTSSRVLWSRDIGDSDSSLSFADNTALASIYVGTNAGRLYKLNAATGATCWGSTSDSCAGAGGSEQFFCADPAVNARGTSCSAGSAIQKGLLVMFDSLGRVVFSTADGNVRLLNNVGVQQWRTNIPGASAPLTAKNIGTGFVYVGSNTGLVYQLALATGAVVATRSVGGGSVVAGNPSLDVIARRLYVTTSQGNLYAFNVPF